MYRHEDSIATRARPFLTSDHKNVKIGETFSGMDVRLPEEALDSHIMILGKTGMGKSTILNSLCDGIISNKLGNVIMIDPHETLSRRLLSKVDKDRIYAISTSTESEGDMNKAMQFNVLNTNGSAESRDIITGWIRDLFFHEDVFSGGTWGPRLEVVFRVLLSGYMDEISDPSLEDFLHLVSSVENIRDYLKKIRNRPAADYFSSMALNQKTWAEYIGSTVNKLLPVVSNKNIRNLISGMNKNDTLKDFLDRGNGFVPIMMDKNTLAEETYRVASILMLSMIFNIIRSSENLHEASRNYIVIDEAQTLPAGILLRLLNEGRKFGIRLILSTQHLKGLSQEIVRSVLANVGTFVAFSISGDDAKTISDNIFPDPFNRRIAEIMKAQGRHSAIVWNLASNGQNGPLSFKTFPLENIETDTSNETVRFCVLKYGSIVRDQVIKPSSNIHENIIEKFREFIVRNDINWEDSKRVAGHVPDGLFLHDGTQYIVEVENSDLLHKYRLLEKVATYSGRKIIFICREGGGKTGMEMIRKPTFVGEKNGLVLEVPVIRGEKTLHFHDLGDILNNAIILEYNGRGFTQIFHNKVSRFSIARLPGRFGAGNYIPSDKYFAVRLKLYEIMISTGIPFVSSWGLTKYQDINPAYLAEFFNKTGKETITYTDLFV